MCDKSVLRKTYSLCCRERSAGLLASVLKHVTSPTNQQGMHRAFHGTSIPSARSNGLCQPFSQLPTRSLASLHVRCSLAPAACCSAWSNALSAVYPHGDAHARQARSVHVAARSRKAQTKRPPQPARPARRKVQYAAPTPPKPAAVLAPPPVKPPVIRDVPNTSSGNLLSKYLVAGKLIQFKHDDDNILGLIQDAHIPEKGQRGAYAVAVDVQGTQHKVKPTQIVVVLPGKEYDVAELQVMEDAVRPHRSSRVSSNFMRSQHVTRHCAASAQFATRHV